MPRGDAPGNDDGATDFGGATNARDAATGTSDAATETGDAAPDTGDPATGGDDAPPDAADAATGRCTLCDLPLPEEPLREPDGDGAFCCRGCLEVHGALGDSAADAAGGLDLDAEERSADGAPVDADSPTRGGDAAAREDAAVAYLAVDGMHCTTCERFLEARAGAVDGVLGARASYATETLRVAYDPDAVAREALPDAIGGYGYALRDREAATAEGPGRTSASRLLVGGLFGMMAMLWYVLVLYPPYLGLDPVVEFGTWDLRYVHANVWLASTVVLGYAGWPILRGAYVSLRAGAPNVDLLVGLAATAAYAYSALAVVLGRGHLYFDVSVAIVLVVTAGGAYERRVRRSATGLVSDLVEGRPERARRAIDGEVVDPDDVEPGEHLLVRPGERVPLDGTVVEGTAAVDESVLSGEPEPVDRGPGDPVRGGSVVTDAPIEVRVGEAAESTRDRLLERLWDVQSARRGAQRLADRLATAFVPLVVLLAVAASVGLLLAGAGPGTAALVGLTVLVVACPCALGLATPLAVAAGVRTAAERGIGVVSTAVLEAGPDVDVVVLDKTGTLTEGEMTVGDVHAEHPERVLELAAALERCSAHPIAGAITRHARERGVLARAEPDTPVADGGDPIPAGGDPSPDGGDAIPDGSDAALDEGSPAREPTAPGVAAVERHRRGLRGRVGDATVTVGHPELLREHDLAIDDALADRIEAARAAGDVPVAVGWGGAARGVIAVGDEPRSAWRDAVASLADGRELVVLTGDDGPAADDLRDVAAIDAVYAGVPPEAKAETVRRLRRRGTVAMVGDGTNDAPALGAADLGVALGSGTDVALDAADAVVLEDDLGTVADLLSIAATTRSRVRQNLGWALVYNAVAIPLAVAGLLNPLLAALAMGTSSALVVTNSARSLDGGDGRSAE